jgi:hypothetical protein
LGKKIKDRRGKAGVRGAKDERLLKKGYWIW